MISRRRFLRYFAAAGAMATPAARLFAEEEDDFFTIAALPDTQYYARKYPKIFESQTRWLAEHREELRLAFVAHEGDVTDTNAEAEWEVADRAMKVLEDAGVPYGILPGNHDMGAGGKAKTRDTALFNRTFGVGRFEKSATWTGHFEGGNDNSWHKFDACGVKLLVLCLEFGARDEVLDWAGKVCAAYPERQAIVVTHCYMNHDDTRVGPGDGANPHGYGVNGNDGEDIWEKLVRRHASIFLVLSGHIGGDMLGRQTSRGDAGNDVHEILANYQFLDDGGGGRLRLLKVVPARRRIFVTTFSPWLKSYDTAPDNVFDLPFPSP